jgi:PncC family amidohydrolase
VVAYGDGLKRDVLGVAAATIEQHGSVSAETAQAMAAGVQRVCGAEVGVALTGIAGPGGARPGKPVGLVFVAGVHGRRSLVRSYVWSGDRAANRVHSASAACRLVLELMDGDGSP